MKINIIYPKTKIHDNYIQSYNEYIKRLTPYCKIKLLPYKKFKDIEKYLLNENTYILTKNGSTITTNCFADLIDTYIIKGNMNFIFCDEVTDFQLKSLCLSKICIGEIEITLLLEQIYRSYTIFQGKTYHK